MNRPHPLLLSTMLVMSLLFPHSLRAGGGIETLGSARFTIITPQLIRMEYSPDHQFVDVPSWFARRRDVRDIDYQVQQNERSLTIDTGKIRLVYTSDDSGFDARNLRATIYTDGKSIEWNPSVRESDNLGGANRSLDRIRAAVPIEPGLISRDGWHLYDESTSVVANQDWFEERPKNHSVDWYFFGYGSDYKAALKSLVAICGDMPLPRKSVLGTWYSRNWPYTEGEFKKIVEEYHQYDFPLDNIVMDYGWHKKGWTGYTWNTELIPDPAGLLKWFHEQGLAVTLNDHPDASVQPTESMYRDFMNAMGQNPDSGKTIPYDAGDKKFMNTFWKFTHVPRMAEGVDFWWLDMGKPLAPSLPSLDGLEMLNDFYFKMTDGDGKRGQSFSRWAGWGDHRNPIQFSGDADTGWKMLAFEVPFTSTSGNVGCFFWSHDTGGYRGGRNEESYARWTQFSAVAATLRSHCANRADMDRRPWKWPDWATDSMRRSYHLRASLIPYVYSIAHQAVTESVPFIRPLYIDHPGEEAAYHNGQEYLFGDDMLAAPITAPGEGKNHLGWQRVWFPDGPWYQYFTGEKYDAGSEVVAAADINEFPLFVRGGVAIPEQPYSERPTSTPLKTLVLRCFPGDDGRTGISHLYEDDGISGDYKRGGSATTELSYSQHGNDVTVRIAPTQGHYAGQVTARAYVVLLCNTAQGSLNAPSNATLSYDSATSTNRIEIPESSIDRETVVKVSAPPIDSAKLREKAMTRRLDGLLGKPFDQWTDADRAATMPVVSNAIEAIHGRGLMSVSKSPYLYGNDISLVYLDPAATGAVDATLALDSWSNRTTVRNGQPIDFAAAAEAISPAETIDVPGVEHRLRLKVAGRGGDISLNTADLQLNNLAIDARPTTNKGRGENAIDGIADGAPAHGDNEWTVPADTSEAWIKLAWADPVRAKRVLLFDRPSLENQVLAGKLSFSDGTSIPVGELPNDGKTPADISFPEKTITWLRFDITQRSTTTKEAGLAEIGVFDR